MSPSHHHSTTEENSSKWHSLGNSVKNKEDSFKGKQNRSLIVSRKSHTSPQQRLPNAPDSFSECGEMHSTGHTDRYPLDEPPIAINPRLKEWLEEFSFGKVANVIVQYFSESPSTACWVIQQKDVEQKNAIVKNLNFCRSFDTIDSIDDIKIDRVYSVQFEGVCQRGIVLFRINSQEVWVRLIDNGRCLRVRIVAIRELNQTMSMSVKGLAFEIHFENWRSFFVDEELRVENIGQNSDGGFDVRLIEDEKIFTDCDITSLLIPTDIPLEMLCLDYSNIEKCYISACENDPEKIESIAGMSYKIGEYFKRTDYCERNYCPQLNELCLSYAEDEGQWYRSKCVEIVMPNTFRLEMIDYGVLEEVNSKNISRMVKDFLEPTILHRCTLFGKFFFA